MQPVPSLHDRPFPGQCGGSSGSCDPGYFVGALKPRRRCSPGRRARSMPVKLERLFVEEALLYLPNQRVIRLEDIEGQTPGFRPREADVLGKMLLHAFGVALRSANQASRQPHLTSTGIRFGTHVTTPFVFGPSLAWA